MDIVGNDGGEAGRGAPCGGACLPTAARAPPPEGSPEEDAEAKEAAAAVPSDAKEIDGDARIWPFDSRAGLERGGLPRGAGAMGSVEGDGEEETLATAGWP